MEAMFKLPKDFQQDAEKFRAEMERLRDGAISAAQFRAFRVPLGVYEQREAGSYMLRVRLPAGAVLPQQMRALARTARDYGSDVLHVTTRQDIQIHRVLLENVAAAFAALYDAGLSTRGGGGNTVRNITGCHDAGVCPRELFDLSPYALALTEFLLPDPLSYQLPRKYKIAFSGCSMDCAGVAVNDLGFIARRRDGAPGFAVYVGGGMGAKSRVGELLEEFVPAGKVHLVAEAVKRVFDKHGNRKNRHQARLRFLIEKIGLARFRELYEGELTELRTAGLPDLEVGQLPARERAVPCSGISPCEGFAEWRQKATRSQKQPGYFVVQIPLWLGDLRAETLDRLAGLAADYGEGMARATQCQNLVIRWVHENELPLMHAVLVQLGLAGAEPPVLRDLVACTGAATCKLGICLSRGLAAAVRAELTRDGLDLDEFGDLRIHISGCPNSCGRHPIADIGLFGAARRLEGRLMPHYVLQLGGQMAEGQTRLADGKHSILARSVPVLVRELLHTFRQSVQFPDFSAFLGARGEGLVDALAQKYQAAADLAKDESYYTDWDASEPFSLAGRGPGECGAGVFDLIEVDLASAREALRRGELLEATVLAARALLVTQGQEGRSAPEVLELFTRHFLAEKLLDQGFSPLLEQARRAASGAAAAESFAADANDVARLVEAVGRLYDTMDSSLRFRPATQAPPAPATSEPPGPVTIQRTADFRGVVCPLNYVKTKMVLDQLRGGAVLAVLLDEPGARSVPASVERDGHEVLAVRQEETHWQVVIRKAR